MWAEQWILAAGELIGENREWLIELDRAIGDGDHGENLDRGHRSIVKLDLPESVSAAEYLRAVGSTLISTVGGAAGPLYGLAFVRMADVADDEFSIENFSHMLDVGTSAIEARGHVSVGEKTMLDTWVRVSDVAHELAERGADLDEAIRAIDVVAKEAAESTVPMKATKGRAAYLGEDSIGHMDPGAASSALVFRGLNAILGE